MASSFLCKNHIRKSFINMHAFIEQWILLLFCCCEGSKTIWLPFSKMFITLIANTILINIWEVFFFYCMIFFKLYIFFILGTGIGTITQKFNRLIIEYIGKFCVIDYKSITLIYNISLKCALYLFWTYHINISS